jgi:insulysin
MPTPDAKTPDTNGKKMFQGPGVILCALGVIAGGIAVMVWIVRLKFEYPSIITSETLTDKPRLDHREYKWSQYSNGLEVLNIQDKETHAGGFAMAISAGSFSDPQELRGLAHFCEHMLFLGTSKYPVAGEFDTFLNMYSGSSNAYTAQETTVYYATLDGKGMSEGLDRFTDMFSTPLFDRKFVQKEVHAIDSEHAKNRQSPDWRVLQVMSSLANSESPVASFHTGNLATLYTEPKAQGIDPVSELTKYFEENYCPPRMRFVTFGQASVDSQQRDAFEKLASLKLSQRCQARPQSFAIPQPYSQANLAKYVHINGTQPQGQLWVFFNFPDLRAQYKNGALAYIQHMLTHRGEHSLWYALCEDLGLTVELDASADMTSAGTAFWVIFSLTPKGTAHPELVLDAFLLYIRKMQAAGVDKELYHSLANVTKLMWDWSELDNAEGSVQDLAERMTRLPHSDLLKGGYVITQPNPHQVQELIDGLDVSNMNVGFVDPKFMNHEKHLKVNTLPFYGVQYTVEDLKTRLGTSNSSHASPAQEFALKLKALMPTIKHVPKMVLPKAIKHIPQDVTLDFAKAAVGNDDLSQLYGAKPDIILNDAGTRLMWFRQGSMSTSPKVTLKTFLRAESTVADTTARDSLIFSIFSTIFSEELTPKTVDLAATGISYGVSVSASSLDFTFSGFKHNLPHMMHLVLHKFQHGLTHNAPRFHRAVQNVREALEDKSSMPVDHALSDLSILLHKNVHSHEELLQALEDIQFRDVSTAVKQHLSDKQLQLTSFVMGNIEEAEAKDLHQKFEAGLALKTTLPISKVEILEQIVNPGRRVEIRKHNPRENDGNHVTVVSILYDVPEIGETALFGIVGNVLGPLVYEELRTTRQLGYVVQGDVSLVGNVIRASVLVQGDVMKPDDVEPLIDWILAKRVPEKLANMTDNEFQTYKDSYIKSVLEPPLGLSSEVSHYWPLAARGGICPDRALEELTYVREQLTDKKQLLEAWNRLVLPGADKGTRSRVVVKYFSKNAFDTVPERPSEEQVRKALEDLKLPSEAIELSVLEYKNAKILNQVSSKERGEVLALEGAGYYPAEYKCRTGPKVPEEIISATSSKLGPTSMIRSKKGHANLRTA